jgi:hypothetical protein
MTAERFRGERSGLAVRLTNPGRVSHPAAARTTPQSACMFAAEAETRDWHVCGNTVAVFRAKAMGKKFNYLSLVSVSRAGGFDEACGFAALLAGIRIFDELRKLRFGHHP